MGPGDPRYGQLNVLPSAVSAVGEFVDLGYALNPLNGLQLRGRYLQPAYGGIFEPLDVLARGRLAAAFGIAPYTRFAGEAGEQKVMFVRDPAGNALEFKAFADDAMLFAT